MDLINMKIEAPMNAKERYMYMQILLLQGIYKELKKLNENNPVEVTDTAKDDIIKTTINESEIVKQPAKRTARRTRKKEV